MSKTLTAAAEIWFHNAAEVTVFNVTGEKMDLDFLIELANNNADFGDICDANGLKENTPYVIVFEYQFDPGEGVGSGVGPYWQVTKIIGFVETPIPELALCKQKQEEVTHWQTLPPPPETTS